MGDTDDTSREVLVATENTFGPIDEELLLEWAEDERWLLWAACYLLIGEALPRAWRWPFVEQFAAAKQGSANFRALFGRTLVSDSGYLFQDAVDAVRLGQLSASEVPADLASIGLEGVQSVVRPCDVLEWAVGWLQEEDRKLATPSNAPDAPGVSSRRAFADAVRAGISRLSPLLKRRTECGVGQHSETVAGSASGERGAVVAKVLEHGSAHAREITRAQLDALHVDETLGLLVIDRDVIRSLGTSARLEPIEQRMLWFFVRNRGKYLQPLEAHSGQASSKTAADTASHLRRKLDDKQTIFQGTRPSSSVPATWQFSPPVGFRYAIVKTDG